MEIVSVKIGSPSQATKVNIEAPEQVKVTFKDVVVNHGGGSVKSVNGQTGDVILDAAAVGALPNTTKIPANTSDLINNSGFITKTVSDLTNYYLKSETYSREEINNKISAIPKFNIEVVTSLPTTGISNTTVYLVKSGDDSSNIYTEYIYANGKWEILGSQTVDLSEYALKKDIPVSLADLEQDTNHRTVTDEEKKSWNSAEPNLVNAIFMNGAKVETNEEGIVDLGALIHSDGIGGDPRGAHLRVKAKETLYTVPYIRPNGTIGPALLPLASATGQGVITAAQFSKLEGIAEGAEKNVITSVNDVNHAGSGAVGALFTHQDGTTYRVPVMNQPSGPRYVLQPAVLPLVTTTANGAMSASDKVKLDALPDSMSDYAKQSDVDGLSEEIADLKQNTPSSESVLTIAQVEALDGMFKKCAFVGDVTVEYTAFKKAFGIEGGGEEEPDTPSGELPTDGLVAYFDFRNVTPETNTQHGYTKFIANQGNGCLYTWSATALTSTDDYGAKFSRGFMFDKNGGTTQSELGKSFSILLKGHTNGLGGFIENNHLGQSNLKAHRLIPKYNNTSGSTTNVTYEDIGDIINNDYVDIYLVADANIFKVYIDGELVKNYNSADYGTFASWFSKVSVQVYGANGYATALVLYDKALTEAEVVEARAFLQTLEVV